MTDNSTYNPSRSTRKPSLGWLAILLLLALYFVVRPMLTEPASDQPPSPAPARDTVVDSPEDGGSEIGPAEFAEEDEKPPAADVASAVSDEIAEERRLGQLTDVGNDVLLSTAGLRYTPGSQEGHRLEHVLRHDNDQPSRPGLHGVFDGDKDDLLAVLDEAYLLVKQRSPRVQSRREQDRMVYEVDMRRRIGFVGGQEGRRKGNPPATHVRLVLEDDRVITVFPF